MTAQTDPTPNSRRSPMEHERDLPDAAQTDAPERIYAETDKPHAFLDAWVQGQWNYDEGAFGGTAYVRDDLHAAAQNRAYWLAIAICGGEDAPGYVDSVPLATLTDTLRKERRWRDDALDAAQAEIAKLRAALDALRESASIDQVDGQVISAAFDLGEKGKANPAWAFIDYEANAMSFGRWGKGGRNPAPYVRLDLVLPLIATEAQP